MRLRSALCCLLLLAASATWANTITIDATQRGIPMAPTMYGLFFEEINHSGDGGLYAELVRNRGFEDYRPVEGSVPSLDGWHQIPKGWRVKPDMSNNGLVAWSLVNPTGSDATINLDRDTGLNKYTGSSLRLEITSATAPGAGIANEGYWGMGIKAGEGYNLSYYVKSNSRYRGKLTAYLEDSKGQPVSNKVTVSGVGTDWKQFKAAFRATGTDPKSRLVILADSPGTLWFDFVSLFPAKTWNNRANGFRVDIAEMLVDTKPGFFRYPGGCIVEGLSLANAFNWKDTIGPIEERPGKWNLWGYRRTDGFGYHEFLQFCEDINAEPLMVVNCGISCQWRAPQFTPVNRMDQFIQDALDCIEYANGPVTSKWGALRAKAGHPKPFNLRYLEIGNENWGTEYAERYVQMYEAVKAKYPDMIIIANNILPGMKLDINDEHYYNKPEFFIQNADKYDSYDRNGPKVFLGEIACTEGCGLGNLRAALGEAAFIIGAERNPDIVQLIAYAPLLVNTNNRVWSPDAIVFDSSRVYGTPSYHLFKLFGVNRPDFTLPTVVEVKAAEQSYPGKVGVGTIANTCSEFKDIRVEKDGKVLFTSDFANGSDGWDLSKDGWTVVDGCLQQAKEGTAMAGDRTWKDYTLTVKARKISGNEGFTIYFGNGPSPNVRWNLGGWGNNQHAIQGGGLPEEGKPGKIETGKWYDIRVELKGGNVKCYLDGELIHDVNYPPVYIYAIAGKEEKSGDIIVKCSNPTGQPYPVDLKINGAKITPAATEIVMSSNDPWDENTFEEPTKVAPVTRQITGASSSFSYTFQPYSLTILRLKTK